MYKKSFFISFFTHDCSPSALALSAGQAAPRVPGAGGAGRVGETHNLEKAEIEK